MKKLLLSLLFIFCMSAQVYADIMPVRVSDVPSGVLGVYQPATSIKVFENPDSKSKLLYQKKWTYITVSETDYANNLFAVLKDKKDLSFVYATDMDEDYVKIIYDKTKNSQGWAYKEDEFQFLPWITFYNMYGRKYGLKILKDAPDFVYDVHSRSDNESQVIGKLNRPKEIRLTAIQGNWALVTALDLGGKVNTGFIRWRGDNGELYVFPDI